MAESEPSKKSERRFQLFLVLLGFVLGVGGTYFWQLRQDNANINAVAALLRAGVRNEVSVITDEVHIVRRLKDASDSNAPKTVRAMLRTSSHDPSTYLPGAKDLGVLKPLVISSVDYYVRELKQCQSTREKLLSRLEADSNREDVLTAVDEYLASLNRLGSVSNTLLDHLDKYYPEAT